MVGRTLGALALIGSVTGCFHAPPKVVTQVQIQKVEVPVPVILHPPAALTAPLTVTPPRFIAPSDPTATSALNPDGEQALRDLFDALLVRLAAWQAWACPETGCPAP